MLFIRYGKLKPVKQLGYTEIDKSYHSPPSRRGFYAMPYKFQELFLIGSIESTQKIVLKKNYKKDGYYTVDYSSVKKTFKANNTDTIWSHIDIIPNHLILARDGSWVQTTVGTYIKFLNKFHAKNRLGFLKYYDGNINSVGRFSKDSYEVFFDNIK